MAKNTRHYFIVSAISFGLILVVSLLYYFREPLRDWYRGQRLESVPTAVRFDAISNQTTTPTPTASVNEAVEITSNAAVITETNKNDPDPTAVATPLIPPAELNLAIPFTSQAPQANWDLPYQEACEEASSLMAARFLQNRSITNATDADQGIVELVDYNVNELHQPIDTTAEQTANLLESFYQVQTEVIYNWSWDDVKQALAHGYPVILPAAGRELGNPNFTAPGPLYHMIVIKGYTPNVVITNDPGTRRGADYQYSYETLSAANHDWNGGDVMNGRKVIIIVQPGLL